MIAINDLNNVIGKLKVDFEDYKKAQETTETQATSGSANEGAGEPQTEHQGQEVKRNSWNNLATYKQSCR